MNLPSKMDYLLDEPQEPINVDPTIPAEPNNEPAEPNVPPTEPNTEPASEPTNDEDHYMKQLLKSYGISDGETLIYQNENDEEIKVKFEELTDSEKFNILQELSRPDLSDSEIETINYLRENNLSLETFSEKLKEKAINDYLQTTENPPKMKSSIDDYSDDEIYLAELKTAFPYLEDEELLNKLNVAKTQEDLFTKEVSHIREKFITHEKEQRELEETEKKQNYDNFVNNVNTELAEFKSFVLDEVDNLTLDVEDADKTSVYNHILKQDEEGYTPFFKSLNDPKELIKLAWFQLYGEKALQTLYAHNKSELAQQKKALEKEFKRSIPNSTTTTATTPPPTPSEKQSTGKRFHRLLD